MSTDEIVIYHNPRCSKSRETLKILTENGQNPRVIKYLETPPSMNELRQLLSLLGLSPRDLLRTGESAYLEAGLDDPSIDDETILRALAEYPILMQRPIVVRGKRAVIGRPPDNVTQLLD